ncbi:MAG TPA: radical SAM protein [Candidatus Bathyarchaeia archaeon]|nr:radical SAM protein [Candidatus Bathyarchaeia archaeon]
MKVLFIEPPKDIWFVMGEYLPPPYGIIQLAAYLEREVKDARIEILDCNAQQIDWPSLEKEIETSDPDIVASSSLATCNTYVVARTLATAKKVNSKILTVAGGQHFTATAQDSLEEYPEIDAIVRGEGEQTLTELVKNASKKSAYPEINGISFRHKEQIVNNPPRPLIEDLESLPFPGYHLVKDIVHKYHFAAMAGRRDLPYQLVEGSRGCSHECTFCTQWRHWQGRWRVKSAGRIADEMEFCYQRFGGRFLWLTDDNLGAGSRAEELADEIIARKMPDLWWFVQARCDDIVKNKDVLPKLRRSGLRWVLLGVENSELSTLDDFKKGISPGDAKEAVKLLKKHDIFGHAMFIIGNRRDSRESIARMRRFLNELDPDFAIFAILTPFPGSEIYEEAKRNGWIQDTNWANYDMVHAIMPTETLTTKEVQEELYRCYRTFYGSWNRRLSGMFSRNELKRRVFLHMASRGIIRQLKNLF